MDDRVRRRDAPEVRLNRRDLRSAAIRRSLFRPTTLQAAIDRLGFVQADPIRAPARAQDLILRHRVRDYRAEDLERRFSTLAVDEEYLFAYGFLSRVHAPLMHPRRTRALAALERQVLQAVTEAGRIHPRDLEQRLQRGRAVNAWGGYSNATTRALARLQRIGLVRVTERTRGVRVYEVAPERAGALPTVERLERLTLLLAALFAPAPLPRLKHVVARAAQHLPKSTASRSVVDRLVRGGALASATVDGIVYAWPAGKTRAHAVEDVVRFLAPFDPVVWDRDRFEHLWGWPYRFEAYVPAPKRQHGYYALPLLWRDDAIGWVNVSAAKSGIDVRAGYVRSAPKERAFKTAFDDEVERMRRFLR